MLVIVTALVCGGAGFLIGSYFMCCKMRALFIDRAMQVGMARTDAITNEVIWKDDRLHYIIDGD